MGLSGCYGLIKYILVFVNLIFWALGLTTVVLAIWMLTDSTFLVSVTQEQDNYNAGLYILLAGGALMLIVAFLGCCGAFRESQCMLVGFFSCLLVVVVAQIAAGAWLYNTSDRLEALVTNSVMNTIKKEYGIIESRTKTVDAFQSGLQCCGAKGPSDWVGSSFAEKDPTSPIKLTVSAVATQYPIPRSCCKLGDDTACEAILKINVADIPNPGIYNEGCINKLVEVLKSQGCIILGVTIGIGILEFLCLIFSLVLCCAIGSPDRYKA
ncbi:CD9 antigen [Cephus cinctus]|uniref:Tetraspanin n=1 Tax=Cephus cinctus TaxID=211228 RepID=A0AAJ7BYK1_CEPCN|nr:CD9 antigen [Cephus cinctus]